MLHRTSILLLLTMITSCTKIDNGDLDGFWQLASVDTLSTGHSRDMVAQRVFWSIQGKMIQMETAGDAYPYDFLFEKSGETLSLSHGIRNWRDKGDILLQDSDLVHLSPLGVNSLSPTYDIQQNNRSHLILKDAQLRLHFNKF